MVVVQIGLADGGSDFGNQSFQLVVACSDCIGHTGGMTEVVAETVVVVFLMELGGLP